MPPFQETHTMTSTLKTTTTTAVHEAKKRKHAKQHNGHTDESLEESAVAAPVETAAALVATGGRLCLLIGANQTPTALGLLGSAWQFTSPMPIPLSNERVVLVGSRGIK